MIPFVEGGDWGRKGSQVVMFACLICSNTCLAGDITLCAQEAGRDKDMENYKTQPPSPLASRIYRLIGIFEVQIKLQLLLYSSDR